MRPHPHTPAPPAQAVRVNVGRLGVVTRVQMRIVPETAVQRTLHELNPSQLLDLLREAQHMWQTSAQLPAWMSEAAFFWITQSYKVREANNQAGGSMRSFIPAGSVVPALLCPYSWPAHSPLTLQVLPG